LRREEKEKRMYPLMQNVQLLMTLKSMTLVGLEQSNGSDGNEDKVSDVSHGGMSLARLSEEELSSDASDEDDVDAVHSLH
jgi:hypothetical protein